MTILKYLKGRHVMPRYLSLLCLVFALTPGVLVSHLAPLQGSRHLLFVHAVVLLDRLWVILNMRMRAVQIDHAFYFQHHVLFVHWMTCHILRLRVTSRGQILNLTP